MRVTAWVLRMKLKLLAKIRSTDESTAGEYSSKEVEHSGSKKPKRVLKPK